MGVSNFQITGEVQKAELVAALEEVRARCTPETSNLVTAVFRGFEEISLELSETISLARAEVGKESKLMLVRTFE